jgi:hypothetical protein
MLDIDPADTPIDGHAASEFLTNRGFHYAEATLTRMRSVGGGPVFLKHGRRVVYRPSDLLAWIKSRTVEKTDTTSGGITLRDTPTQQAAEKTDSGGTMLRDPPTQQAA